MPMEFSYGAGLTVDYSSVKADRKTEQISVRVSQHVATAEIIAYGAEKKCWINRSSTSIQDRRNIVTVVGRRSRYCAH